MAMKTDGRDLDAATLSELRRRGVAAVQAGESPEHVAAALGVNLRTVFRWLALYRRGGWGALDAAKRGGRPPKLDGRAMRWIYRTIADKNQQQLNFPFALWIAEMVQSLIAQRFNITLSHSSVCRLLNQLGLSAQRPLWRAYQQDPDAVKQWLEKDYPAIRRRAKREGAHIFFADEAGVRSDYHSGTTWGKRGQTPIVSSTGARFGANLISAVSAQGQLRFMVTKGRVTAAVFIEFLKRLMVHATTPVFVIVDGHPTHKAKSVERYVAAQDGRLALFLLPPYSPELNPDELVWADLKAHGTGRTLITSLTQLRQTIMAHLRQRGAGIRGVHNHPNPCVRVKRYGHSSGVPTSASGSGHGSPPRLQSPDGRLRASEG
jgi:transposase